MGVCYLTASQPDAGRTVQEVPVALLGLRACCIHSYAELMYLKCLNFLPHLLPSFIFLFFLTTNEVPHYQIWTKGIFTTSIWNVWVPVTFVGGGYLFKWGFNHFVFQLPKNPERLCWYSIVFFFFLSSWKSKNVWHLSFYSFFLFSVPNLPFCFSNFPLKPICLVIPVKSSVILFYHLPCFLCSRCSSLPYASSEQTLFIPWIWMSGSH